MLEGSFVKPNARFIVSDDFQVMPLSTMAALDLIRKAGSDGSTIEEHNMSIGRDEVLNLLKYSLTSRRPLSDTLLEPPNCEAIYKIFHGKYGPRRHDASQKDSAENGVNICFKLIVNKCRNETLYAEVREDFVNLLCSFLTFPLGYLFEEFPSLSFKGCMDNLYKSIQDTEVSLFSSNERKEILIDPKLAPGIPYKNQLVGIKDAPTPYSTISLSWEKKAHGIRLDKGEDNIGEGFVEGPCMFMVMDNLTIMPLSPVSSLSHIKGLHVPLNDIGEQEVTMGENEALRLLVASLVSNRALTDTFLLKEPKEAKQELYTRAMDGENISGEGLVNIEKYDNVEV